MSKCGQVLKFGKSKKGLILRTILATSLKF